MEDLQKTTGIRLDNVTVQNLGLALRMCDIQIPDVVIGKIIELVELIEDKEDEVAIKDIIQLQDVWENQGGFQGNTHYLTREEINIINTFREKWNESENNKP